MIVCEVPAATTAKDIFNFGWTEDADQIATLWRRSIRRVYQRRRKRW